MLKKIVVLLMMIIVAPSFVQATEALENDQNRIQQEREEVQEELSYAESELVQLAQELEQLNQTLTDLNNTIEENEKLIEEIEEKIAKNEAEIQELDLDVELLQNDIDQRVDLLKERARSYQRHGNQNISYLEVVLGAESFGDFVNRLLSITKIAQADNHFIDQLESNQQELFEVQEEYEETLFQLVNQVVELELIHEDIEQQKEETLQLRDEMKANEREQEELIAQLVTDEQQLASQEQEIRDRIEEEARRQEEARLEEERQKEIEARAQAEREAANNTVSRSNSSNEESSNTTSNDANWRTFEATAYTANCVGCSGVTSTGIDLRANPNAKVIAVDPSVIPLGSRVEVRGYGTFLAADIGGAIVGNKIDIFMPNRSDALRFGRQTVQIRVLD
ncbi:3D domain-containing protein [Evansella cellulosilytica]|uniref:3D domain-containing protein n=1 Tax=Evansella cellulosilytica (strain ATCC 21833 / DSM 2522 / FERM P-1141 / JCM 9156 / N-4) TaxID=649639 RepID=E6TW66_EVAC2|nr:3D domain-containing protein [Evansella cellulosilytica]ADU31022.1 3D domain-containing protein [Evansella cellulosilytica DSM 2522]